MAQNFKHFLLLLALTFQLIYLTNSFNHKNNNKLKTAIATASDPDFSYYHTTQDIDDEIINLSQGCNGMLSYEQLSHSPDIKLLNINKAEAKKNDKLKAFLLFGEHAREMISPEAGLNLLQVLCDKKQVSSALLKSQVEDILNNYQIQIVLNANPISRKQVETGDYCIRTNENGVDINRNWDAHWEYSSMLETNSGEEPFSELETQLFRDALTKLKPHIFLTVHSGTYGMYTPYAYSQEEGTFNEMSMLSVTDNLNKKYCNCESGAAGKQVGYLCPGTCLDYAYDKLQTPYAFAWEIYEKPTEDEIFLQQYSASSNFLDKQNNISKHHKLVSKIKNHHHNHQNSKQSCFLQTSSQMMNLSTTECFQFFNPGTQETYTETVDNWTNAMIDMFIQVKKEIN